MMGFGLILALLILGAIAYAGGWRPQFNQPASPNSERTALDILRERYARGEIDTADYQQMRQDIER